MRKLFIADLMVVITAIAACYLKIPVVYYIYSTISIIFGMSAGIVVISGRFDEYAITVAESQYIHGKLPDWMDTIIWAILVFLPLLTGNYFICISWLMLYLLRISMGAKIDKYYDQYKSGDREIGDDL